MSEPETPELASFEGWLELERLELEGAYTRLRVEVVLVRDPEVSRLPRLRAARDVYIQFSFLSRLDRECFAVLLLDTKNRVTGVHIASLGFLGQTPVHPREVFKAAVVANAAAIIVLHNHPSGDPTPSEDDWRVTERLKAAGELLGITVLDHVIVAADGYWSLTKGLEPFPDEQQEKGDDKPCPRHTPTTPT